MVYTLTFNPALDYVVHMDALRPGALNRARREQLRPGGKGINVSTVLRELGVDSTALGFLAGSTGEALERALRERGIRTDFIRLPEGLTRINVKVQAEEDTEINGSGPAIPPSALEALSRKLERLGEGDVLVLSGSVPPSLPQDTYGALLRGPAERGVLCAVDAAGDLLSAALPCRPFLIKPNHHELGEIFGGALTTDREIVRCAAQLRERGARNVLVSMAGDGSLLLDEGGGCRRLGVPPGQVRDPVGAGDSMVAGFLAGWLETGDYAAAHRLAAAAGSATAFSDGLATREEILALLDAV